MYWAQAIAGQATDRDLASLIAPVARALEESEETILSELEAAQGHAVDIGGYYHPDDELASRAMRPSPTLNAIIAGIAA